MDDENRAGRRPHRRQLMGPHGDFWREKFRENDRKREAREERARQYMQRLDRFLMGGCAGGAIAMLTVIGGFLSGEGKPPIPWQLTAILMIFMVGLLGSWTSLVGALLALARQLNPDRTFRGVPLKDMKFERVHWVASSVASVALIAGAVWAVGFLISRSG